MQIYQIEKHLESLQNILAGQLGIYHQLLDLVREEKSALSGSKLEIFNDVATRKIELVQSLNQLEERRKKLMVDLSVSLKIDREQVTLKRLVDLVDQFTSKRLLKLRTDLSAAIQELKKENDVNRSLMNHRIKLIDNSINLLNSLGYDDPTYIQTGHIARPGEGGVLFSSKI